MAEGDLVEQLARVRADLWRSSELGEIFVLWLPLVPISESGLWLGVDREGNWILGRLRGGVVSSIDTLPQPWLTILDMDEAAFRELLDRASLQHGLPLEVIQDMAPVNDILSMALRSGSKHWAERATRWLVARTPREDHLELLSELVTARWASQWTRQAARQLVSASSR